MSTCFFVSDLHGQIPRYQKLFEVIARERPEAVFLGGDLLPAPLTSFALDEITFTNFVSKFLVSGFKKLKEELGSTYPQVFLILGNDDPRSEERNLISGEKKGLWVYLSDRRVEWRGFPIYGYAYVSPTPFLLKDWERFDVSRFVDPGCISPEEGWRSVPVDENEIKYATIQRDLERLMGDEELSSAIILFHTPPYQTALDRAALDGRTIDGVPLDVHVGSIAVRRFIDARQPLVTLHGHIHESPRLTGSWKEKIGRTNAFSAAHDGEELALVRFDPKEPEKASRELIKTDFPT